MKKVVLALHYGYVDRRVAIQHLNILGFTSPGVRELMRMYAKGVIRLSGVPEVSREAYYNWISKYTA